MTKYEIIEGNKLIAEFMGEKLQIPFGLNGIKIILLSELVEETDKYKNPNYLNFHWSWNWLMPVVEKIESCKVPQFAYEFELSIKGKRCVTISNRSSGKDIVVVGFKDYDKDIWYSKIEAVWLAVVEFIKWYNQNK